ncbi:hypothetical protein KQ945_16495 [Bacillus subtilis subsp. subtilis]|nr:hypothetical protein [Bacillus subtilis subsp. subtilis]
MVEWSVLDDAYGSAETVGVMLEALDAGNDGVDWDVLWSHLCHQSTVYPASFHALPYLLRAALRVAPAQRLEPLVLAGAIVSHADHAPVVVPGHPQVLQALQHCADDTLQQLQGGALDEAACAHLLQASLGFRGERLWSRKLAGVLDGELAGVCPACGVDLYIVIDAAPGFVTDEEWVGGQPVRKAMIEVATSQANCAAETWLLDTARSRPGEVSRALDMLLGTSTCTHCQAPLAIRDAVRLGG